MRVTYDPYADAMYIYFNNLGVKKTSIIDNDLIVDYDKNKIPVGFELLSVSKKIPKKELKSVKIYFNTETPKTLLHK